MKHDKITVLDPNGKRFQVSRRKLSPNDGGTAKSGQLAIATAGVAKKRPKVKTS